MSISSEISQSATSRDAAADESTIPIIRSGPGEFTSRSFTRSRRRGPSSMNARITSKPILSSRRFDTRGVYVGWRHPPSKAVTLPH